MASTCTECTHQTHGVPATDHLCSLWLPPFHTCLVKQIAVQTTHHFPAVPVARGLVRKLNRCPACKEGSPAVGSLCVLPAHLEQTRAKYNFHLSLKNIEHFHEYLYWGNVCKNGNMGLNPGFICPSIHFWWGPVTSASGEHKPFPGTTSTSASPAPSPGSLDPVAFSRHPSFILIVRVCLRLGLFSIESIFKIIPDIWQGNCKSCL